LLELDLSDAEVGDAGAVALAESPHLDNLLRLDLRSRKAGRPLGAPARRALRDRSAGASRSKKIRNSKHEIRKEDRQIPARGFFRISCFEFRIWIVTDDRPRRSLPGDPRPPGRRHPPRLIYADALEDVGESDRAALIRAQVELARVPEHDPSAVRTRVSEVCTASSDNPNSKFEARNPKEAPSRYLPVFLSDFVL